MPVYRVAIVMPVSCVVEVEVNDNATENEIIDAAFESPSMPHAGLCWECSGHWSPSDPDAYDHDGTPYGVELVED